MASRWIDSRSPRACGSCPVALAISCSFGSEKMAGGTSGGMCEILPLATPPPEKERGLLASAGSTPRVCRLLMILQSWLCIASWSTWRPLSSASWLDWIPRLSLSKKRFCGSSAPEPSFLRCWVQILGRASVISAVSASSVSAVAKEPRSKTLLIGEMTLPAASGCSRTRTRASSSILVACVGFWAYTKYCRLYPMRPPATYATSYVSRGGTSGYKLMGTSRSTALPLPLSPCAVRRRLTTCLESESLSSS